MTSPVARPSTSRRRFAGRADLTARRGDLCQRAVHNLRPIATMLPSMAFTSAEPLRLPRPGRVAARGRAGRRRPHDGSRRPLRHRDDRIARRVLRGQAPLEPWCAARGYDEALVGGFFVRPDGVRWARCARAASRAASCPSTRRGMGCAPACTCAAASRRSPARRDRRTARAATCCRRGRCSSATARPSSPRRRRRGLQRRRVAVRLRHHRRPPPARGARPGRRPDVRRRLRRPLAPRLRADLGGAGRVDGRARLHAPR